MAFLVVAAVSLQGPSLAYAAAAKTMPATCAGHVLSHPGNDATSCCPQRIQPGICCAGGFVLAGMPSAPVTLPSVALHFLPAASGSVPFATERPAPPLRPPIA